MKRAFFFGFFMAKKKKKYDWEAIEREYRLDQLSNREISRQYGVPESSLRTRAKKRGWLKDLTERVKQKVSDELLRSDCAESTDKELVESAGRRGADIIRSHRKDIRSLQELESQLISELYDKPTKLYMSSYQGVVTKTEVGLTAAEKAQAANNLANVQHKRIQLERQAFNLNDGDDGTETSKKVTGINVRFVG